jgi:hypothetical protein
MNELGQKDEVVDRFEAGEYGNDFFNEDPIVSNISIAKGER